MLLVEEFQRNLRWTFLAKCVLSQSFFNHQQSSFAWEQMSPSHISIYLSCFAIIIFFRLFVICLYTFPLEVFPGFIFVHKIYILLTFVSMTSPLRFNLWYSFSDIIYVYLFLYHLVHFLILQHDDKSYSFLL